MQNSKKATKKDVIASFVSSLNDFLESYNSFTTLIEKGNIAKLTQIHYERYTNAKADYEGIWLQSNNGWDLPKHQLENLSRAMDTDAKNIIKMLE